MSAIDFDGLRAFTTVATLGAFHDAARLLAISQSSLSRRIQKLEDAMGVPLLSRTTRRVALTPAGRDFLPRAEAMVEALDNGVLAARDLAASHAGRITIACVPSAAYYFLPAALVRLHARLPEIDVRIVEDAAQNVLRHVRDGTAEIGVGFLGQADDDIEFTTVMRDPFVLACRFDDPLAARPAVRWAELRDTPFITAGQTSGNRLLLDRALAPSDWPRIRYEVQHLPSSLGLVEAGLGVVALPLLTMPAAPHPVLVHRPLIEPEIQRSVGVVRRRGHALSGPAMQLFRIIAGRHGDAGG